MDYRNVLQQLEKVKEELSKVDSPTNPRIFQLLDKIKFSNTSKAWKIMSEGRVKKHVFKPSGRVRWVVLGDNAEYIVYPAVGFCSCSAFYFFVKGEKTTACCHLIAQTMAETLGWYEEIEVEDGLYNTFMSEWTWLAAKNVGTRYLGARTDIYPEKRKSIVW